MPDSPATDIRPIKEDREHGLSSRLFSAYFAPILLVPLSEQSLMGKCEHTYFDLHSEKQKGRVGFSNNALVDVNILIQS